MPSTDIATLSAVELESQLLLEAQDAISTAQEQVMRDDIERAIVEHYEKRAKKLMERIWKDCKKRTKHRYTTKNEYSSDKRTCRTCHYPERRRAGYDDDWKFDKAAAISGISKIGQQLRQADREAGIEWIP
jgi:hypothetical protein